MRHPYSNFDGKKFVNVCAKFILDWRRSHRDIKSWNCKTFLVTWLASKLKELGRVGVKLGPLSNILTSRARRVNCSVYSERQMNRLIDKETDWTGRWEIESIDNQTVGLVVLIDRHTDRWTYKRTDWLMDRDTVEPRHSQFRHQRLKIYVV